MFLCSRWSSLIRIMFGLCPSLLLLLRGSAISSSDRNPLANPCLLDQAMLYDCIVAVIHVFLSDRFLPRERILHEQYSLDHPRTMQNRAWRSDNHNPSAR